ncbi:MAG: UDP-2,3-diacylglucosamine diphosphatase [Geobacteraceae bacterium]
MRKIFIADAHLKQTDDENYRKLLKFLAGLRGATDTLFIVGDLFEFWIGHPFNHYTPVLEELRALRASGVNIVYFEGNHDFHMGPFFEDTLAARVYPGPAILELDGKRVYICHGDQINRREYSYRLLRLIFHNPLTRLLSQLAPPAVSSFIAARLSAKSRRNHRQHRAMWDYAGIIREFAAERFREGCDVVITAHFHTPFMERSADKSGRVLLSLGDWITHFSYGEWQDGVLSLKTYDLADTEE